MCIRDRYTGFSKTYNTDSQTPDSAGTMSAMATGVKTRAGVLSIGQDAERRDCAGALRSPMLTLWELAATSGLATGVVTTTRITHATPGATFTHSADRNWENDAEMPPEAAAAGCTDIARQLIESPYGPVSYTHLDVYKRQIVMRLPDQPGGVAVGRHQQLEDPLRHPGCGKGRCKPLSAKQRLCRMLQDHCVPRSKGREDRIRRGQQRKVPGRDHQDGS